MSIASTYSSTSEKPQLTDELPQALFILSIQNDLDESAELRVDLKRSTLGDVTLQQKSRLDEGLNIMAACSFDVVVVDINLPDSKGLETLKRIRSARPGQCVVVLTTRKNAQLGRQAVAIGANDHLIKEDINPSLLERSLRTAISASTEAARTQTLEDRLGLALEAANMGCWEFDPFTLTATFDRTTSRLLGYEGDPQKVELGELINLVDEADRLQLHSCFEKAIETAGDLSADFNIENSRGSTRHITLKAKFIKDPGEQELKLYGIALDVTHQKELLTRIQEANTNIVNFLQIRDDSLHEASRKLQQLAASIQNDQDNEEFQEPPQVSTPTFVEEVTEPVAPAPKISKPNFPKIELPKKVAIEEPIIPELTQEAPPTPKPESPPQINKEEHDDLSVRPSKLGNFVKKAQETNTEKKKQILVDPFQADPAPQPTIEDARRRIQEGNPVHSELATKVKNLVNEVADRYGIECHLSLPSHNQVSDQEISNLLFNSLSELVSNVVKHAQAKLCIVSLFRDEEDWVLEVEDDGVGLNPDLKSINAPLKQIGLFTIRTTIAPRGGQLMVLNAKPHGVIARIRLPLKSMAR